MREEENQVAWLNQRATQQFVAGEPRGASFSSSVVRRRLREDPRPPELNRYAARVTMDNAEATAVLTREMARYRAMPHAELILLPGQKTH